MNARRPSLLALLLLPLASPALAQAATPVVVAPGGNDPAAAIDGSGAAHIVYRTRARRTPSDPEVGAIGYCKLPRGAAACSVTRTLFDDADVIADVNVFVRGTTIEVYDTTQCGGTLSGIRRFAFTDGSGPVTQSCKTTSPASGYATANEGLLDYSGRLLTSGTAGNGGGVFGAFEPGTAAATTTGPNLFPGFDFTYGQSVGSSITGTDDRTLGVASGRSDTAPKVNGTWISIFKASATTTTAALNTAANWSAPFLVPGSESASVKPVLAGFDDLYAVNSFRPGPSDDAIQIAKLHRLPTPGVTSTATFQGGPSDQQMTAVKAEEDATGLTVTWLSNGRLRLATSGATTDHGASLTLRGTVVAFGADDGYVSPDLATGFDGRGVAVWQTSGSNNRVLAVPLEATPDPLDAPPPPDPGPPATTTTTTTTTTKPPDPPYVPPAKAPSITAVVSGLPSTKRCVSKRSFKIRLRNPKGTTIVSASVKVNGKSVATVKGKRVTAPVDLKGLPKGKYTVKIAVKLADGSTVTGSRTYRTCAKRRR